MWGVARRRRQRGGAGAVGAMAALAPALLGSSCGPTPFEAGCAVLLATPVAVLVGLAMLLGLQALWRRRLPQLRLPLVPALAVAATALLIGLLALSSRAGAGAGEWLGVALITFGPSYLTLLLLAWRICLALRPESAANGALASASAVMVLPAVLLVLRVTEDDGALVLWVYPGIYFIPTLVIALVLFVEAALRRRRGSRPA